MIDLKKKVNSSDPLQFRVLPENIQVSASQNQTILDAMLGAGIEIDHSCGGMGSCGTCRVWVVSGLDLLGPRGDLENEIAQDRRFSIEERLSCQNQACAGLVIEKPN